MDFDGDEQTVRGATGFASAGMGIDLAAENPDGAVCRP
jgi:hypothetical protein